MRLLVDFSRISRLRVDVKQETNIFFQQLRIVRSFNLNFSHKTLKNRNNCNKPYISIAKGSLDTQYITPNQSITCDMSSVYAAIPRPSTPPGIPPPESHHASSKRSFGVVCSSNINRSMEAHVVLGNAGTNNKIY